MFRSSIVLSVISLIISLVSFFNQITIANYFGANKQMDMFLIATSIPTMFGGLISAALSYSLIPHFIKCNYRLKKNFSQYLCQFFLYTLLIIFFIATISFVFFYNFIPTLYNRLNLIEINLVREISLISWITFIFSILFSILTSYYNSLNQFYYPLILNIFPFVGSILYSFIFHEKNGIIAIVIGTMIGTLIALLFAFLKIGYGLTLLKEINRVHARDILKYLKELRYSMLAMLCFTIYQSIDGFWASKLGSSNLSYLGYCQRIIVAFGSLIIIGPSTVIIPRLTLAVEQDRFIDYLHDTSLITKLVWLFSSFIAMICSVLATPIIIIMFQRGAFTQEDTSAISNILPLILIGMTFMLCVVVLFRALFVINTPIKPAILGVICTVTYFILSAVLSSTFSLLGIAYAYVLTWAVMFFLTINAVFFPRINVFFNIKNLHFFIKQLLVLLVIYQFANFLYFILIGNPQEVKFIRLLFYTGLIGILSFVLYLFIAFFVLKIDEVRYIISTALKTLSNTTNWP